MTEPLNDEFIINSFLTRFSNHELSKKILKNEFESFIQDTSKSLDTRWSLFLEAPSEMSNSDNYIYHGLDFIHRANRKSETWLRDYDYERHTEVSLLDLLENIIFSMQNPGDSYGYDLEEWPCLKEPGIIVKIKEQLLKDNIKSFVFDW